MWKKIALVSLYIFYAIALTLILLVVRFPKETFLSYAGGLIEQELPGTNWIISDVTYIYPYGFRLDTVNLTSSDGLFNVAITNVIITLDPRNLLGGFNVGFNLYDGVVESDVILRRDTDMIELPAFAASGISLERIELLQQRLGRTVNGIISFSGQFLGRRHDLGNGNFSGTILVSAFRLPMNRPILKSNVITFDEVSASFSMDEGQVLIEEGRAVGQSYDATFSGQIASAHQWQESELEISGTLSPKEKYMKQNRQVARAVALLYRKYKTTTIPYKVSGSFREPVFQFGDH